MIVNVEQPNRAPDAMDDLVMQAETDGGETTKVTDHSGDAAGQRHRSGWRHAHDRPATSDVVGGTLTQDAKTKSLTFETTNANFVGDASFKYTISDGRGGTDTATVTIAVTQHQRCARSP